MSLFFFGMLGFLIWFTKFKQYQQLVNNQFMGWQKEIPFIIFTILYLVGTNIGIYFLLKRLKLVVPYFTRLNHRQLIARMVISNRYYETVRKTVTGANGKTSSKEKIIFPKIYLKQQGAFNLYTFPTDGGKFHDAFLKIGKKLEEMFLSDLVEEIREFGFIRYKLLTNVEKNRISIEEVTAQNSTIHLMTGIDWHFDEVPHMLIAGGTGGGKTYFLYTLINAIIKIGTVDILDPKQADLADLRNIPAFNKHVTSEKEWIFKFLERAVRTMEQRYAYMKSLPNYQSGKNYAYYNMPPHFIIIDEWVAFYGALDFRERDQVMKSVQQLVLKARQSGVFLIMAMQRPDAEYLGGGIRDNLLAKVTLGQLAPVGYHMVFGEENKNKPFYNKPIKGRGYIDLGTGTPREFYAPLVPRTFDFIKEFEKLDKMIELDMDRNDESSEVHQVS
jgi:hypothetical protein